MDRGNKYMYRSNSSQIVETLEYILLNTINDKDKYWQWMKNRTKLAA